MNIDFKQAKELLELFGGEPAEIALMTGDGHSGNGLYAVYTADTGEGSIYLGETDEDAAPPISQGAPVAAEPVYEALKDILSRFTSAFPESEDYEPIKRARAALAAALPTPQAALVAAGFSLFVDTPQKRFLYNWGRRDGYQDGHADALATQPTLQAIPVSAADVAPKEAP